MDVGQQQRGIYAPSTSRDLGHGVVAAGKMVSRALITTANLLTFSFFLPRRQPWEHFIPVRPDFSDLLDKLEWCERHLDVCQAVSKRASEYIR